MLFDKVIKSPNFIKRGSPNYYILLHTIIECNFTLTDARDVLNVKYPRVAAQIDDDEFDRLVGLYDLLCALREWKFKQSSEFRNYKFQEALLIYKKRC